MAETTTDKYSAGEQGLGYIYQGRLALYQMLQLPESTIVFLEKDDDVDFEDGNGSKSLASLKHKAEGERLTDLSTDFWKSVRIWLARYKRDDRAKSNLRFFLFTTGKVSTDSFLKRFLPGVVWNSDDDKTLRELAEDALAKSKSASIGTIAREFNELTKTEKEDFLARIQIFDRSPRIGDLPKLVKEGPMRIIRPANRDAVFERLEGWWNDQVIRLLTGARTEGIPGDEISEKIISLSEEYKSDNLPITFLGKQPAEGIDTDNDPRPFVRQLREIGISKDRIHSAILDFYRAFEQRSEWARENLLVSGELDRYEDRLVDEWRRYKDVVFEELDENSAEDTLKRAGKDLYRWADLESGKIHSLRIRERVTEPYVTRGSFHILANATPTPRIYWHPRFLERVGKALGVAA
ncbi:ABC-three component system protein [Frateuria sp. YIM B11624]|uniref:ABC-three component system protein n=1 Tax=Frateuria sp. YIM B11624 TaxID=3143185 RepID=UPI003C74D59A